MSVTTRYSIRKEGSVCAATFWLLLARNGEAELLAASVIFFTWVEAHLVGRCWLDMSVKYSDIHYLIKIVSKHLVPKKSQYLMTWV